MGNERSVPFDMATMPAFASRLHRKWGRSKCTISNSSPLTGIQFFNANVAGAPEMGSHLQFQERDRGDIVLGCIKPVGTPRKR